MYNSVSLVVISFVLISFRSYGDELLQNKEFETGDLSAWYVYNNNSGDNAEVIVNQDGEYLVLFTLSNGGGERWEAQILQPVAVRSGYRYSIAFGAIANGGAKYSDWEYAITAIQNTQAAAAYEWAVLHPSVPYVQSADCENGEYKGSNFSDEFFFGVQLNIPVQQGVTRHMKDISPVTFRQQMFPTGRVLVCSVSTPIHDRNRL